MTARYLHDNPAKREWVRGHRCCVCERRPPSNCCHVCNREGFKDDRWTVPMCWPCHMRQHDVGLMTFCRRVRVNLFRVAREMQVTYSSMEY